MQRGQGKRKARKQETQKRPNKRTNKNTGNDRSAFSESEPTNSMTLEQDSKDAESTSLPDDATLIIQSSSALPFSSYDPITNHAEKFFSLIETATDLDDEENRFFALLKENPKLIMTQHKNGDLPIVYAAKYCSHKGIIQAILLMVLSNGYWSSETILVQEEKTQNEKEPAIVAAQLIRSRAEHDEPQGDSVHPGSGGRLNPKAIASHLEQLSGSLSGLNIVMIAALCANNLFLEELFSMISESVELVTKEVQSGLNCGTSALGCAIASPATNEIRIQTLNTLLRYLPDQNRSSYFNHLFLKNPVYDYKWSLLMLAMYNLDVTAVHRLLEYGADPNFETENQASALKFAYFLEEKLEADPRILEIIGLLINTPKLETHVTPNRSIINSPSDLSESTSPTTSQLKPPQTTQLPPITTSMEVEPTITSPEKPTFSQQNITTVQPTVAQALQPANYLFNIGEFHCIFFKGPIVICPIHHAITREQQPPTTNQNSAVFNISSSNS